MSSRKMERYRNHPTVERTAVRPPWLFWLLLPCVISALAAGCAPAVQYQPNEGVVDTLGIPEARRRLQETLTRSINPQVTAVEVTDDFLNYHYRQAIAGFPTGAILENRIHFLNIGKVEVYDNNIVIIRTMSNIPLAQFIFGNPQDPRMFADIISSFRARRAHSG